MPTREDLIVVLCTAPDAEVARRLAQGIVEARLAACVNVLSGARSFYRWEGRVEDASEQQLLIKTLASRFEEVRDWLLAEHPYDVPEILALPVAASSDAYGNWVVDQSR